MQFTTNRDFTEPRYYSQYDTNDTDKMYAALRESVELTDIGERIDFIVKALYDQQILCGQAQRLIIFDAIWDSVDNS